jgi:hypothetical protein
MNIQIDQEILTEAVLRNDPALSEEVLKIGLRLAGFHPAMVALAWAGEKPLLASFRGGL